MIAPGQPRAVVGLQRWFFERVTAAARGDDADERHVLGGRLSAGTRIDVYRHAYVARLIECLADDYPATAHALGAPRFESLCRDFIAHNPPASASLNYYGAAFAEHCAHASELPNRRFIGELARLEWALVEAVHADAELILDAASLANVTEDEWPRVRLVPSPTLRVLPCSYPVHRYYQSFLETEAADVPGPEPEAEPCGVAVCRRGDDVWRFGLGPAWLELLERLRDGAALVEALGAFEAAAGEQEASALQRTFSEWVAAGFFSGIAGHSHSR